MGSELDWLVGGGRTRCEHILDKEPRVGSVGRAGAKITFSRGRSTTIPPTGANRRPNIIGPRSRASFALRGVEAYAAARGLGRRVDVAAFPWARFSWALFRKKTGVEGSRRMTTPIGLSDPAAPPSSALPVVSACSTDAPPFARLCRARLRAVWGATLESRPLWVELACCPRRSRKRTEVNPMVAEWDAGRARRDERRRTGTARTRPFPLMLSRRRFVWKKA